MIARLSVSAFVSLCLIQFASADVKTEWWAWRGPNGNGVAPAAQTPATEWSDEKNVVWKTAVPGRGKSSPIVVGDKVILTTADETRKVQSVVCFDRATGKQLWKTDVNTGGLPRRIHRKNTHATPTVASNGKQLFAVFNNNGNAQLTALGLDGKKLWQKNAGPYAPRAYRYGYAPSPVIYKSLVIVGAESEAGGFLAGFDQKSGDEKWRTRRPAKISYSTPAVARVAGKDQLLISGNKSIYSYDPATGKPLWTAPGICRVTCGTMVWNDKLVFASGGYPERGTIAVAADGSKKVAWSNTVKCYEQSLLVYEEHVYAVADGGVAYCWRAADGKQMWSKRLGGNVSASPVLAGGNIYLSNERGTTYVFKADPKAFTLVARNQLGNSAFATPTICGDRLYLRVAQGRQEFLCCIGKKR